MPVFGIALFGLSQFSMSTTLKDIRQRVGLSGFLADTTVSAATSLGTTTTLIDTALKQPDDFFNYGSILILTGLNAGAVRYITDWVQSTSTFTLDRALDAAVASAVQYEVHRLSHPHEVNNSINEAIRAAGTRWTRQVEDESLELDSTTYTYSLDSLAVQVDPLLELDRVMYDTGLTGTGYPFVDISTSFRVVRNDVGALTLQFLGTIPRDGADLRLIYRVRPAQLSADTDLLAPQDESFYNFVCAKAASIEFRKRALNAPDKGWEDKAKQFEEMAELYFGVDKKQAPSKPFRNEMLLWGKA
jgi:hypothetical protein